MLFGTDGFQIELRWFYIERRRTLLRHIEPFHAVWNRLVPNRTLPVPHGTAKNYFFSECIFASEQLFVSEQLFAGEQLFAKPEVYSPVK